MMMWVRHTVKLLHLVQLVLLHQAWLIFVYLAGLLFLVIYKHLEPKRVVLVIAETETIVYQEKSVRATAIAVEQLITFKVPRGELRPHGKVHATIVIDTSPP